MDKYFKLIDSFYPDHEQSSFKRIVSSYELKDLLNQYVVSFSNYNLDQFLHDFFSDKLKYLTKEKEVTASLMEYVEFIRRLHQGHLKKLENEDYGLDKNELYQSYLKYSECLSIPLVDINCINHFLLNFPALVSYAFYMHEEKDEDFLEELTDLCELSWNKGLHNNVFANNSAHYLEDYLESSMGEEVEYFCHMFNTYCGLLHYQFRVKGLHEQTFLNKSLVSVNEWFFYSKLPLQIFTLENHEHFNWDHHSVEVYKSVCEVLNDSQLSPDYFSQQFFKRIFEQSCHCLDPIFNNLDEFYYLEGNKDAILEMGKILITQLAQDLIIILQRNLEHATQTHNEASVCRIKKVVETLMSKLYSEKMVDLYVAIVDELNLQLHPSITSTISDKKVA